MRSDPENRALSAEKKSAVLVLILFADLLLISSQIMLKSQRSLLHAVVANMAAPVQLTFQKASDFLGGELDRYVFLRGVFRKYQLLQRKQIDLRIENYALKRELNDRRAAAAARRLFNRYLLAGVISVDVNYPYATVLIDKGTRAGLVENNVVLNRDGDLVGRVVGPLTAFTAPVRLITSPVGGTGAAIEGNMLEGLLKGENRAECGFEYLLASKEVRPGERVVTSGTDMIYPSFLPIGRVTAIAKDFLTQRITVRPFFVDKPLRQLVVLLHE